MSSGAGRPLHDEVRALEPVEECPLFASSRRCSDSPPSGRSRRSSRSRCGYRPSPASTDAANRRSAAAASVGTGRPGTIDVGSGASRELVASAEPDRSGRVVDRRHGPAGSALARILGVVTLVELVLLRREPERPLVGTRAPVDGGEIERRGAVVLRQPIASPSSTSSSSVIVRRRKYHHQAGRASRLWYSRSRASKLPASLPPPLVRAARREAASSRSSPLLLGRRVRLRRRQERNLDAELLLGRRRCASSQSRSSSVARQSSSLYSAIASSRASSWSSSQRSNSITASFPELTSACA